MMMVVAIHCRFTHIHWLFFLQCAFFRKNGNRQILLMRLNCASEEFFAAQLLFSESFSENNVAACLKKENGNNNSQFFPSSTLLLIKNCAEKENEFFSNVFIYSGKKLLRIKMGSKNCYHPTLRTKKHISDKNQLLLFSLFSFYFGYIMITDDVELNMQVFIYFLELFLKK